MAQYVLLPRLSQDMTQGRLVEWLKQAGDPVSEGEPLASIETEKAVMELQAPRSGVLAHVFLRPGDDAEVGTAVAIVADAGENIDALLLSPPTPRGAAARTPAVAPRAVPADHAEPTPATGARTRQQVSPVARRVARELGVDVSSVVGTGAGGLVTEGDVRTLAARGLIPAIDEASEDVEVIPLTGRRRRIAERMSLSRQTAADVTTVVDVDMTQVVEHRRDAKLSYTAYVLWAASQTLKEFPILNASLAGDRILVKRSINIGVATANQQGLVVPVVRGADRKSVAEISQTIDALAARAQAGDLAPEEMTGGTFTITNSGAFGSLLFTPIINCPEVAILGMGKVADTPVARDGHVVIRHVMYLCLSYDHRVVDGGPAVQFINAVKRRLEHWREGEVG
ncbi:MAG: dihydrolipoamide acetyltransferase family protein [Acidobacteriota bacterium]